MNTYELWITCPIWGTSRISSCIEGVTFNDACKDHFSKRSGGVGLYNDMCDYNPADNTAFGEALYSSENEAKINTNKL